MINKKGNSNNEAFGYLILFAIGVFALYFLFQFLLKLGGVIFAVGLIAFIIAIFTQNEKFLLAGIILMVVGGALYFVGISGVGFFENNEVGVTALDSSRVIMNATVSTYETMSNVEGEVINQVMNSTKGLN